MDYIEIQDRIVSYINRSSTALGDNLLFALNNAKKWAQRRHNFSLLYDTIYIPINSEGYGQLTLVESWPRTTPATLKKFKQLRTCSLYNTDTEVQIPLILAAVEDVQRDVRLKGHGNSVSVGGDYLFVQKGSNFFLHPYVGGSNYAVLAEAVTWLPDYGQVLSTLTGSNTSVTASKLVATTGDFITNGVEVNDLVLNAAGASARVTAIDSATSLSLSAHIFTTQPQTYTIQKLHKEDFFTNECSDFLLYRSLHELNFFLKEDQRVQLSGGVMAEVWDSVKEWDSTRYDASLDRSLN